MTKSPLRAAWLLAAAASWTTIQTANALSIPVNNFGAAIFDRATSGCASGFSTCPGFTLPSSFCCPANSVCNVLAGNTTLLCCPTGQNCTVINPITCDLSQQDPETHPEAPIKTSALNGVMTKCGDSCCPFGYNCNGNGLCVMQTNQNAAPLQNVPTTTATKAGTSTATTSTKSSSKSTSTASASLAQAGGAQMTTTADSSVTVAVYTGTDTATAAAPTRTDGSSGTSGTGVSESAVASADDKSNGASAASIAGGVVGGLAGVLLMGAAVWFLCGRRLTRGGSGGGGGGAGGRGGGSRLGSGMKQRDPMNFMSDANKLNRSTSSFGNIINNPLSISSPKPQGDATAFRTDFIRKPPFSGDYSRPVTPASSFGGGIGSSGDAPSSTVGSVGYPNGRAAQQQKGKPSPPGANLDRELPSPPSPSPPPLALRQARDSISVPPIRGMRTLPPRVQQPKHQPREPSTEEINVGVDPSIIAFGGNFAISPPGTLLPPGRAAAATTTNNTAGNGNSYTLTASDAAQQRNRSNDRLTTFSSLLQAANLDPQRPYVPNSVQSSPASRRR
ncbi:hypothetical protein SPBR_03465 [Sporothrix brasiliensis 5110]|uniref:Mid2 domain-containing protein n=1 Tax=Sporothrix brasiliensis 5110 TaxID=1398154 RepID=A0A0C2FVN5_9PEZI|nr:uncharacterized protein SPBR_03465 [Sporothrix brasiliensis 5110]KIH95078.1 hypothetical protein SPBR_03465 [Sporothrix brasiliensis 5110]